MNFCNCGCYLGFDVSPYFTSIEDSLIYNTKPFDNTYRNEGIQILDYKLNNLLANGLYPKYSYFSQPIVKFNSLPQNNCCIQDGLNLYKFLAR